MDTVKRWPPTKLGSHASMFRIVLASIRHRADHYTVEHFPPVNHRSKAHRSYHLTRECTALHDVSAEPSFLVCALEVRQMERLNEQATRGCVDNVSF